ncbi:DUF58 domain-containing protein [Paenibacillus cymbidii]|uniref:DUF58 domain-containing protein n=1 Tax=Paenibacillus cymbidii TaxID=1639034 RepID=UPI001080BB91|nr:DUF58 domain-containing protein [Paenibacillus cymbidii]
MSSPLFQHEPELLHKLDRMALAAKNRISGTMLGKRRSSRLGASLEFADYRPYAPGDDVRRFDWNVYGRTGKPFVKQFMDEQELQVHLYVDISRSMTFGAAGRTQENSAPAPSASKLRYACQLAACVGYMALCGYDRVDARVFGRSIVSELQPLRGKGSAGRLFRYFETAANEAAAEPAGDLAEAVRRPSAVPRLPGLTWLISDLLFAGGVEETLAYLQTARQELVVVQVLSPEELEPQLAGDVRLIDSEFGTAKEVAISDAVLGAYRQAVAHYQAELQRFCRERGIGYACADCSRPLTDTVQSLLRARGYVQ